jgi:pantetheine-phosphate adenylyltransferase
MSRIAVYPGSFDPITSGHMDLIVRGARVFDKVIVGIGVNSKKAPLFSAPERAGLIMASIGEAVKYAKKLSLEELDGLMKIEIKEFSGLVVDFAKENNATAIIRGIRNNLDFEAEFAFAHINTRLNPEIEHIYFMASEADHFVSSSVVKELWSFGQGYKSMVPKTVFNALENKRR